MQRKDEALTRSSGVGVNTELAEGLTRKREKVR